MERVNIPVAQISAVPMIPLSVGMHRVVRGISVEHVCGEPELSVERDHRLMMRITEAAMQALQTKVDKPTLFEPSEESTQEAVHAS